MVGVGDEFTLRQAGAGIVADSDHEMETDETEHKAHYMSFAPHDGLRRPKRPGGG